MRTGKNECPFVPEPDRRSPPPSLPPSLNSKLTREGREGDGHAGGGGAGSGLGRGVQRVPHHKGVAGHGQGGGPEDGAVGLHDDDGRSAVWWSVGGLGGSWDVDS